MTNTIPIEILDSFGLNAPVTAVSHLETFEPSSSKGASRYRHEFPSGHKLDALLVNTGGDTLIVTFHGALDRKKVSLPRFERLASTQGLGQSMLFFADPALWADETLQLSWFTGAQDVDLHPVLADWSLKAAASVGATKIVFTGSSGGGAAALHVSALVPNSVCLAFNPQTSIHGYLESGKSFGAQRKYIEVLYPELAPDGIWKIDFSQDWTESLGDRMSALRRYSLQIENFVMYADNPNDFHHEQHLIPLTETMNLSGNSDRLRVHTYEGPNGHTPPNPAQFNAAMTEALAWSRGLPSTL